MSFRVKVAKCECGEKFMATFQVNLETREIEYTLLDRGMARHLTAGHEVTYTKTGRLRSGD